MNASAIPLRTLIALLVGLLASIALALSAIGLQQSLDFHRSATLVDERNRIAEHCLQAVKDFAFERGRTNVILRNKGSIAEKHRKFIDDRRSGADHAIAAALGALPPEFSALGNDVKASWNGVRALREEVERDFALPFALRDPTLTERWFSAASDLISKVETLLIKVSRVPGADSSFDRMSAVRIFTLQFRNVVGTESTKLAAELSAGRIPSAEVTAEVYQLRGQSAQLWAQIERGNAMIGNPEFGSALDKVHANLFRKFRPLQDEILGAAAIGQKPQVTIDQYTAAAVPALDSAIEAVDSIGQATSAFAARQLDLARREMAVSIIAISVTLFIAILSMVVMSYRFAKPLRGILDRIHAFYAGSAAGTGKLRGDELGAVSRSLDLLEESLAARKRMEDELRLAKQGAESANLAKSRFLATVSHEIRTPMNGVLGMAQLLMTPGLPEKERQEYAQIIVGSGRALMAILNDILDLSKVEAGKLDLQRVSFDPDQVICEVAALFSEPIEKKGLRIETAWRGPKGVNYLGDPARLHQMLSNLVSNALKFTEDGFIRIDGRETGRKDAQATLEFSVVDSGIGIPEDKQHLLFQPFSQVDTSATRKFQGTGLGLSIVRRLAELMGGESGVESTAGKGARFWFRIRIDLIEEPVPEPAE